MYAIVDIQGKQFKVREADSLFVPHLPGVGAGETLELVRVLLLANGEDIHVGAPTVENASVKATVLRHVKGDKVIVFKKKRRKRYKVRRGHRQRYTQIRVDSLSTAKFTE